MKITLILYPISLPEVIVTPYFIFLEMLDTKPTLYTVYLIVQIFFSSFFNYFSPASCIVPFLLSMHRTFNYVLKEKQDYGFKL